MSPVPPARARSTGSRRASVAGQQQGTVRHPGPVGRLAGPLGVEDEGVGEERLHAAGASPAARALHDGLVARRRCDRMGASPHACRAPGLPTVGLTRSPSRVREPAHGRLASHLTDGGVPTRSTSLGEKARLVEAQHHRHGQPGGPGSTRLGAGHPAYAVISARVEHRVALRPRGPSTRDVAVSGRAAQSVMARSRRPPSPPAAPARPRGRRRRGAPGCSASTSPAAQGANCGLGEGRPRRARVIVRGLLPSVPITVGGRTIRTGNAALPPWAARANLLTDARVPAIRTA